MYKAIERMTDKEILHLFAKDQIAKIEDKQVQLQKLRNYKSSLRISEICGVISVADSREMAAAYTQDISQLEKSISEMTMLLDEMASHIMEIVIKLKSNSKLGIANKISRTDLARLIKHIVIFSKEDISVNFSLSTQFMQPIYSTDCRTTI